MNRGIQLIAQRYCIDCKTTYHELSKIVQVRSTLVCCLHFFVYIVVVVMKSYGFGMSYTEIFVKSEAASQRLQSVTFCLWCGFCPQGVLASRRELVKYDQRKMEMGAPPLVPSEPSTPLLTTPTSSQAKVYDTHLVECPICVHAI